MTLSGGQKQRLFIALALINDPELVFLDELTTGLDPQARRAIWDLVRGIRDRGKTVFLTTHLMEEAERLCDRSPDRRAYGDAFIEQHTNTQRLEVGNHGNQNVVAEHSIDIATKRFTQARNDFEAGLAIAVGASAIVARQHTKIIIEARCEFSGPMHCGTAHVRVQVAQMQDCEAIESAWQIW